MAYLNNSLKHISDSSLYVTFDPAGSSFPATVTNVDQALRALGPHSLTGKLPVATEGAAGIARIATQAEITTGTDNSTIVTPAKLKFALSRPDATESIKGVSRIATQAEANALTLEGALFITPKKLGGVFNTITMTETRFGTSKVSTQAQAEAMVDNTTSMTPLRVKQAIAKSSTPLGNATETTSGIVRLATAAQTLAGVVSDGYAVTPKNLSAMVASTTKAGMARVATDVEARALSDWGLMISAGSLGAVQATDSQRGIVMLTTIPDGSVLNKALASNAAVVPNWRKVQGKELKGDVSFWAGDFGAYTKEETNSIFLPRGEAPSHPRCYAGELSPGQASGLHRFWDKYSHFVVDITASFSGWGDSRRRWIDFDIVHVEAGGREYIVGYVSLEAKVSKGGSRGHDWQYQVGMTKFTQINAGQGQYFWGDQYVYIRPRGSYQCDYWSYKLTFSQ
ncbi:tail collar fiber protein [Serratia phage 92A1]|nr:tail collar fiber protein [Serratia phage 92A1]